MKKRKIFHIKMPTYEENKADPFSITVLIATVLIVVFLIISSIYFSNLMRLRPPSKSESTFLFWTSLLLTIVAAIIAILAIVHIFTHKHITHIVENKVVAAPLRATPATTKSTSKVLPIKSRSTYDDDDEPVKRRTKTAQKLSLFDEEED